MLSSPAPTSKNPRGSKTLQSVLFGGAMRRALPLLHEASARITAQVPLVEAVLRNIDPVLSLHRVRAQVVEVRDETHDVKTFVLRPNARFGTYKPGSFVTLNLRIGGERVQRSYSLSSAPSADGRIAITVKRVPGGVVSNWLADTLREGDVLELSAPEGQFVLPEVLPDSLLMISAGSGITPVMSMLRRLVSTPSTTQVHFLHFARTPQDLIFGEELSQIAAAHPNVRLELCVEQGGDEWRGSRGRFSQAMLEEFVPDFRSLDTFLCGPSAFMRVVIQELEAAGAELPKLRYERFNASFDASEFLEHSQVLRFLRSGTESLSSTPRTILEEAEGYGIAIESGCRAGTCGTCRCTKKSGVVVDIVTGRESGAGEELIYPCISVARGTVEVDL